VTCLAISILLGVVYWYWRKTDNLDIGELECNDETPSLIDKYLQSVEPGIPDMCIDQYADSDVVSEDYTGIPIQFIPETRN
jgi:hypothetical protein